MQAKTTTSGDLLKLKVIRHNEDTVLTLQPPNSLDGVTRTPVDVCCVIDVSGSMDDEARINTGGNSEGFGLSILDLVKHATSTIIESLQGDDRLAIVTFSDEGKAIYELKTMDDSGRKEAKDAVQSLVTEGSTNLWDGVKWGLDVMRKGNAGRNSAILVLTDGQPNVEPPRGHAQMLEKYRKDFGLPGLVYTFGFGYNLNSVILNEMAMEGQGTYSFIPDGSFVGTIFVNTLANLLTSVASNVQLGVGVDKCTGDIKPADGVINLKIGNIGFGQSKSFVMPMKVPNDVKKLEVSVKYQTPYGSEHNEKQVFDIEEDDGKNVAIQMFRSEAVDAIFEAFQKASLKKNKEAGHVIESLVKKIKDSKVKDDKFIVDLLKDLEGQVLIAVTRDDYFSKWGQHYLPSLAQAHLLQQCNNFKDPGVQHYGGELFKNIRDKMDDIFLNIPAPKPSRASGGSGGSVNMRNFYNSSNPCFEGNCLVFMADGSLKKVQDIKKYDQIMTPNGKPARVLCSIKTLCHQGRAFLIKMDGGLLITEWHPVRINGKWCFPTEVSTGTDMECPAVYSFVLDESHIMIINGVECVTWGHGFTEDVVKHPFFGTQKIIENVKQLEGWEQGLIEITPDWIQRDRETTLITKIGRPELRKETCEKSNTEVILANMLKA